VAEAFSVLVTDQDGDTASDTLDVTVADDVPTAVNDTATVAENTAITIDAFANDTFGADQVDIDNSPSVVVTFTQPTQGTVSYDPNTGLFTYMPAAGAGSVSTADSFSYTLVDGDGDSTSATVSLTLAPDSKPSVTVSDGTVDEKGLPTGSGEQADGDRTNDSDSSETTSGTFSISTGNDSLGALEVQDNTGTWVDVTAGGVVQGVNGVLTVTNTAGVYSWNYTLADNLLTHTDTTAVGSADQQPGEALLVRVIDDEGDVSASDTLDILVNDDGPSNFEPTPVILVNSGDGAGSGPLDMFDNMGADDLGSVVFNGGSDGDLLMGLFNGNVTPEPVMYKSENIMLTGFGTDTLTGTSVDTDTVILKIELNPNTTDESQDQYTITFFTDINDGSGFVFDDFSTAPAGKNKWVGLDKDGLDINDPTDPQPDSHDLLITAFTNGEIGNVNTSSSDIGVDNQWMGGGDGIRLDFVIDVRRDDAMNQDEHDTQGFLYDSHYAGNNFNFNIMQVQGGTTAAVRIRAYDFSGTEGDTDVTNSLNNTVVAIIAGSLTINGVAASSLPGITVSVDGDSIVVEGLSQGDNVAFEASGDFESVVLSNADGDPDGQGSTYSGDPFSVGVFGFDNAVEGDQIDLAFEMLATDADGDTSSGTLDVTISPEGHVAVGTDLDEVLIGDSGVDILVGGRGDDILIGNNGNDTMTGDSGADVFIWSEGESGTDIITDFDIGEKDVLNIADLLGDKAADLDAYLSITPGADTMITIIGDQGNADQIIQLNGYDTTGMNGAQIIDNLLLSGSMVTE
jgi:YD repeat-containing protein